MIKIGEYNKLLVKKERDFGYFLGEDLDPENREEILIPFNNIPDKKLQVESEVDVFIYKDSKDRLIATQKKPLATVGEVALLEVVSSTDIGYFISFGLERDVLVPFKEVAYDLEVGKKYLFYLYLDKSERITASTFVDKHLPTTNHLVVGDEYLATAYGVQDNGTIMVAVQNLYRAVILKKENFDKISMGEEITVRVKRYYEDGKMEVTTRKKRLAEMNDLETTIVEYLKNHNNHMKFCDASSSEQIRNVFKCSKNAFKRSLGGLMKKGMVKQDENGTDLLSETQVRFVPHVNPKADKYNKSNNKDKIPKAEYVKEMKKMEKEEQEKKEIKKKFFGKYIK